MANPSPLPSPDLRTVPKAVCDSVIHDCNEVIRAKDKEIEAQNNAINQAQETIKETSTELSKEKDSSSKFYKNPFFLILLGLIGGFAAGNIK